MDRLTAMQTYVLVVETGSFSGAARCMKVGQPAVSKSIAQLEARLGVRLLIRSTRGLMPTEAGQNFYERARRAIEEADEADLAARGSGADLVGRLRISAAVTFANLHVIPRLPTFMAAHPELALDLLLDDRVIDLVKEGADIALRMGTALRDSSATARKIARRPRRVFAAPAYFERAGIPASPAELRAHTAVTYIQNGIGDTWTFRRGRSECVVTTTGRLRVSAAEGLRAAVRGGMGLAIASEWMFAPEMKSGAVRAVLTDWTLPTIDVWAVFPAGRMASAKARAFAAFMESELKEPIPDGNNTYELAPTSAGGAPIHIAAHRLTRWKGQM
jgi:DNA-binding transcriptional LysR family regulator